jgi:hypothetical protein
MICISYIKGENQVKLGEIVQKFSQKNQKHMYIESRKFPILQINLHINANNLKINHKLFSRFEIYKVINMYYQKM